MPEEPEPEHGDKPPDKKKKEQVLIGAGIAGLVLLFVVLRRSSSSAAAPSGALPVSSNMNPSGTGASVSSGDYSSLANQVYGLEAALNGLEATLGTSSSPTPISSNPAPAPAGVTGTPAATSGSGGPFTLQTVADIFRRYGFSSVPALPGETSQERSDRILRDLNSGARTPAQVSASVAILPGAVHA